MGQKINPIGFRLGYTHQCLSKWIANKHNFSQMLHADLLCRREIEKEFKAGVVGSVVIERTLKSARIKIATPRPGVIIGKNSNRIDQLKKQFAMKMGVSDVRIDIVEEQKPETSAQLIGDAIAGQLEKRVTVRRAARKAIQTAVRAGVKGIKIQISGRINGAEIARSEEYREGCVPLHTLRTKIDYAVSTASTTYGQIGVKVWVNKGDVSPISSTSEVDLSQSERGRRSANSGERRSKRENDNKSSNNRRGSSGRRGGRSSRPVVASA